MSASLTKIIIYIIQTKQTLHNELPVCFCIHTEHSQDNHVHFLCTQYTVPSTHIVSLAGFDRGQTGDMYGAPNRTW